MSEVRNPYSSHTLFEIVKAFQLRGRSRQLHAAGEFHEMPSQGRSIDGIAEVFEGHRRTTRVVMARFVD